MEINCEICDKKFKITPSRLKKNKHHTCSKQCSGKLSSLKFSKKVKKECVVCSKEIFYKKSAIKNIAYPTCSRACSNINKSKIHKGKDNPRSLNLTEYEKIFWDRCISYKRRAKSKNIPFDLDYKFLIDLFEKQNKKCFYTDTEIDLKSKKSYNTLSLDRIDSSKGYIKDNVVFCVNCVNLLKSNYELKDIYKVFRNILIKEDRTCTLEYKTLYEDSQDPFKANEEDAGYDLFVHRYEDKGHYLKIYTGISISPDKGFYSELVPRSSIYKRNLTLYNNVGIIDNLYRGEIIAILLKTSNFSEKDLPKKGDRLVQLIPKRQYYFNLKKVEEISESERGVGGFGSTGN